MRVQKNLNIEKTIFKVVQMKFLAMHINNQKWIYEVQILKLPGLENINLNLINLN